MVNISSLLPGERGVLGGNVLGVIWRGALRRCSLCTWAEFVQHVKYHRGEACWHSQEPYTPHHSWCLQLFCVSIHSFFFFFLEWLKKKQNKYLFNYFCGTAETRQQQQPRETRDRNFILTFSSLFGCLTPKFPVWLRCRWCLGRIFSLCRRLFLTCFQTTRWPPKNRKKKSISNILSYPDISYCQSFF